MLNRQWIERALIHSSPFALNWKYYGKVNCKHKTSENLAPIVQLTLRLQLHDFNIIGWDLKLAGLGYETRWIEKLRIPRSKSTHPLKATTGHDILPCCVPPICSQLASVDRSRRKRTHSAPPPTPPHFDSHIFPWPGGRWMASFSFLPTVKVASCPLVMEKQTGHMPREPKGMVGSSSFLRAGALFSLPASTERRMSKAGHIKPHRQIGFE